MPPPAIPAKAGPPIACSSTSIRSWEPRTSSTIAWHTSPSRAGRTTRRCSPATGEKFPEALSRDVSHQIAHVPEVRQEPEQQRERLSGRELESGFKLQKKSMALGRLPGHTTDLFHMIALTLTSHELGMAVAWQPYTMASKAELLTRFEENAEDALAALSKSRTNPFIRTAVHHGPRAIGDGPRRWYRFWRPARREKLTHRS